tara:strand:+ start:84 stop:731 length:648 start_codon:yes stop_codon:yes gene_type:complete
MDHTVTNLLSIKEEINLKNQNKVNIIAVSKTFGEEKILPLIKYGHKDFGENKVQEAVAKWTSLKEKNNDIKLHMIGKLQTNKVKEAVRIFDTIHSLDSIKLAEKISKEQKKIDKNLKILIQINIGEEIQKSGIDINDVKNLLNISINELKLNITGLMCIPPNDNNEEKYFLKMKELKDVFGLDDLSMGMSNDYLKAIKYGSTYVRIGSKIFGDRN